MPVTTIGLNLAKHVSQVYSDKKGWLARRYLWSGVVPRAIELQDLLPTLEMDTLHMPVQADDQFVYNLLSTTGFIGISWRILVVVLKDPPSCSFQVLILVAPDAPDEGDDAKTT
jgi:hypothetical protein